MNAFSTDPLRTLEFGSISADQLQAADPAARGLLRINDAAIWEGGDTLYCNQFTPASGSTITVDGQAITNGGVESGSLTITGKLSAIPTYETTDAPIAVLWVSDGTAATGAADGDVMLTTWDGTTSSTRCVKAFTPYYQDVEAASNGVTAADGSEATIPLTLSAVAPGTYLMSYTMTVIPNTEWEARHWIVWATGSVTGVLSNSIRGMLTEVSTIGTKSIHHNWVQTFTVAEDITMSTKFSVTGTHLATIDATYPMRLSAVRIA